MTDSACPHCREPLPPTGDAFCPACREPLDEAPRQINTDVRKKTEPGIPAGRVWWIVWILRLLGALGG